MTRYPGMTRLFKVVAALAVALVGSAQAQDELLPVEEAFTYVVADTGSAFEIDWAIYKHAYLYKSRLAFESGTGAIVLGILLDEMERRDLATGLVTLCIGAGMGTATIIERV